MCGIVGVIGHKNAAQIVVNGLKKLEYRGYDSAGLVVQNNGLVCCRSVGKVSALEEVIKKEGLPPSHTSLGHTRWATHGKPTLENTHPHQVGKCAVVHNGIIENADALRAEMEAQGVVFRSTTDTEVVPALVDFYMQQGLPAKQAIQKAIAGLKGAFALGIMVEGEASLWVAKQGSPLVLGLGDDAFYLASDPLALAAHTQKFVFLQDGDMAEITQKGWQVWQAGAAVNRPEKILNPTGLDTNKNGFEHFMLKEIYDQPAVARHQLAASKEDWAGVDLASIQKITLVACGSAYYACHLAKFFIEQWAKVPVEVDMASEFRYRQPLFYDGGLFVAVSQSGETADTLSAMKYAKQNGQKTLAVVNAVQSTIAREADAVVPLHAGVEVAVASTKAFNAMVLALMFFAKNLGQAQGKLSPKQAREVESSLQKLPTYLEQTLLLEEKIAAVGAAISAAGGMLYLGRGASFSMALEGALKMKEITYRHVEAYPSGEMKHGPIALIDENLPVLMLAGEENLLDKNLGSMQEVHARGGQLVLVGGAAAVAKMGHLATHVVEVPEVEAVLVPFVQSVVLQFLAYYAAKNLGLEIDQPRNLAKSVTVE